MAINVMDKQLNGLNIFQYAEVCERMFEKQLEEIGYERKYMFYRDLSIADRHDEKSVKEMYNKVVISCISDVKAFTEFVLSLNYKTWEMNARGRSNYVNLYSELFYKANELAYKTFNGEDLNYYYNIIE